MKLDRFITEMPKAELHLHIEGTLEPELMMSLAERNQVTLPYATVEEVRQAYEFNCLQDFLDVYYLGMSVLLKREDFFDLAWAYLEKMAAQNVTHVEVFFDPQGHTARGVSFDTVLSGLTDAFDKARSDFGITSKLIMCFLRHLSEDEAFDTLEHACACKSHIHGVGLDSSEIGHPPSKFKRVFAEAREHGFTPVAHAGEEGPPAYVTEALDDLQVERIDHGNRALEDPVLVRRIADSGMAMTVCPLSNKRLQVVPDLRDHPLRRMLQAGICATVNSDDPSYFDGYMNENYLAVTQALNLTQAEIVQLGRNSFIGSFMNEADKRAAVAQFDEFVDKAG
ncbi:MAG: adenosine deaminase [Pseudomonadota bacterium]